MPLEMEMVGEVRGAASSFLDEATAERLYQEGQGMEVHGRLDLYAQEVRPRLRQPSA